MDFGELDWIVVLKQNVLIMMTDVSELNSFVYVHVSVCARA